MENFEDEILKYADKIVDKENPQVVTYQVKSSLTTRIFNLTRVNGKYEVTGRPSIAVVSPTGVRYSSIYQAAIAHGKTHTTIKNWVLKGKNGWKMYDEKEHTS